MAAGHHDLIQPQHAVDTAHPVRRIEQEFSSHFNRVYAISSTLREECYRPAAGICAVELHLIILDVYGSLCSKPPVVAGSGRALGYSHILKGECFLSATEHTSSYGELKCTDHGEV